MRPLNTYWLAAALTVAALGPGAAAASAQGFGGGQTFDGPIQAAGPAISAPDPGVLDLAGVPAGNANAGAGVVTVGQTGGPAAGGQTFDGPIDVAVDAGAQLPTDNPPHSAVDVCAIACVAQDPNLVPQDCGPFASLPVSPGNEQAYEDAMLCLINNARLAKGLPPLKEGALQNNGHGGAAGSDRECSGMTPADFLKSWLDGQPSSSLLDSGAAVINISVSADATPTPECPAGRVTWEFELSFA